MFKLPQISCILLVEPLLSPGHKSQKNSTISIFDFRNPLIAIHNYLAYHQSKSLIPEPGTQ
jgi:hypothetical protein